MDGQCRFHLGGCGALLCLLVFQIGSTVSEEAKVCQPGFTSENYTFFVNKWELEPGTELGKVSFVDCPERNHALYSAGESQYHIRRDGTVVIQHLLHMHSPVLSFPVLSWDTQGTKYTATIIVKSQRPAPRADKSSVKSDFPVLPFPVPHSGLSRKKRDFVIPPIRVTENERGPFPKKLAQIKSNQHRGTKVYYSITGEGADQQPQGVFTCERSTGWLFLTRPLDREERNQYLLNSHAVSENGMSVEEPMDIIIKVTDQNDNRPVFTEELFKGAVAEGAMPGTSIMKITATDLDDAEYTNNGIVGYSILNQEPKEPADHMFSVNKATGVISVTAGGLDRERVRLYTLTVQAADMAGEGFVTTASVEIEILDINDNAAIFDPKMCISMSASPNSPLTTHVLNTASGTPAKGLQLQLSRLDGPTQKWVELTTSSTNDDGRCPGILSPERFTAGTYKLRFETGEFWKQLGQASFYPYVEIVFTILDPSQKFHIPLLLSPYSYTTYRGS